MRKWSGEKNSRRIVAPLAFNIRWVDVAIVEAMLHTHTSNAAPDVSRPPVKTKQPDFQAAITSCTVSCSGSITGVRIVW